MGVFGVEDFHFSKNFISDILLGNRDLSFLLQITLPTSTTLPFANELGLLDCVIHDEQPPGEFVGGWSRKSQQKGLAFGGLVP